MQKARKFSRRGLLVLSGGLATMVTSMAAVPVIGRSRPVRAVSGGAFGTSWRATLPDHVPLERFAETADRMLADLDTELSPWRNDSAVTVFNRSRDGAIARGDDLVRVARQALDIARASDGHFDPTVGPLVARFGFGPIVEGSDNPNWRQIEVGAKHVIKSSADTTFDPCGIAKGYALDRIASLARKEGAQSGFIEFGGEIVAWGRHPDGRDWRAGIEDPRPDRLSLLATLPLEGAALATSGNKVNGYELAGRTYGHIIAPDKGAIGRSPLLSVTVLADTAVVADGWATALMAAGPGPGQRLARQNGLSAAFVLDRGEDPPQIVATGVLDSQVKRI